MLRNMTTEYFGLVANATKAPNALQKGSRGTKV